MRTELDRLLHGPFATLHVSEDQTCHSEAEAMAQFAAMLHVFPICSRLCVSHIQEELLGRISW